MQFTKQSSLGNLQQPKSTTSFSIDTPFLSVYNLPGWNGISLKYYRALPGIIGQQLGQHLALVFFSQGKIKQKLAEDTQTYSIVPGSIVLIPASICCQISWLQPLDFAVLILEPSAVEQATKELNLKSDRATLKPRFKQSDSLVYSLVTTLLLEIYSKGTGGCIYTEALLKSLVIHLFQQYAFPLIQATEEVELSSRLNKAIAYINQNLDSNLRLEEIAAVANTSKYHFCRLFKHSVGISPYQYLLQQRIERAKTLLQSNSQLSIADISLRCGFANQSHLCQRFRKFTGITPKAYRKYHRSYVY